MTEAAAADRQTDRRREKEEILDHNTPQILVLFSSTSLSLSLSLSLFLPPRNTRKTREEKESKALELQMEHPTQNKDN
jgi:hypothetical protein